MRGSGGGGLGLLPLRSMAGDTNLTGQAREKSRLLDGCKWDNQPLAAIKFHIRIRGAPCVGFFSCHVAQSFPLGNALVGWELLFFFRRRWACHPSSRHPQVGETLIPDGLNHPFW
mgnify:CR=1 FL=1